MFATQPRQNQQRGDRRTAQVHQQGGMSPFETDIRDRMKRAEASHGKWQYVADALAEKKFTPSILVQDFMRECPIAEVRAHLLAQYEEFILALDKTAVAQNLGRIANFITVKSMMGGGDFLKARILVTRIFVEILNEKVPGDIIGRMNACYRWHTSEDGGGFSDSDLRGAGYEKSVINQRQGWKHPDTGDTYVPPGAKKLTGSCLLTPEEQKKREAENAAKREAGRAARRQKALEKSGKVKVKQPKKDGDTKKKRGK